MDNLRTVLIM